MTKEIDELQAEIGGTFDALIPTDYEWGYIFVEAGHDMPPTFWFCYKSTETGKIIPMDSLEKRKDIIVKDVDGYEDLVSELFHLCLDLHEMYFKEFGKEWHTLTYKLNGNGTFDISFDYEKPQGSWDSRRNTWCMKHLGEIPRVTVDMLRE